MMEELWWLIEHCVARPEVLDQGVQASGKYGEEAG